MSRAKPITREERERLRQVYERYQWNGPDLTPTARRELAYMIANRQPAYESALQAAEERAEENAYAYADADKARAAAEQRAEEAERGRDRAATRESDLERQIQDVFIKFDAARQEVERLRKVLENVLSYTYPRTRWVDGRIAGIIRRALSKEDS